MFKPYQMVFSILPLLGMAGCDNTAKVPDKTEITTSSTTETTAATTQEGTGRSGTGKPLVIGYSDWPGWVAWQVPIEKGWFKQEGVDVEFKWFDYASALSAFAANQLDAVTVTNGDNLINAAGGVRGVIIMATDYSAGNDVVIAKPGINSVTDLKGKSVATETGLVDHLLLSSALQDNGMTGKDIKLVNAVTNTLPQVLATPGIDAIAVWQPVANQALNAVPGSKIIYSSKNKPGLIYDTLSVNASHLATHQEQWKKVLKVWDRTVRYVNDPATRADAIIIMSKKVGVPPEQYKQFLDGTHLLSIKDNKKVFAKGKGLDSIYGSTYHVNQFNMANKAYNKPVDVDSTIYPQLIEQMAER